jgi:hypothetical protein
MKKSLIKKWIKSISKIFICILWRAQAVSKMRPKAPKLDITFYKFMAPYGTFLADLPIVLEVEVAWVWRELFPFIVNITWKKIFEKVCHDQGFNWGPLDLQPNALPTELSGSSSKIMKYYLIYVIVNISICVTDGTHHLNVTTSVCNDVTKCC